MYSLYYRQWTDIYSEPCLRKKDLSSITWFRTNTTAINSVKPLIRIHPAMTYTIRNIGESCPGCQALLPKIHVLLCERAKIDHSLLRRAGMRRFFLSHLLSTDRIRGATPPPSRKWPETGTSPWTRDPPSVAQVAGNGGFRVGHFLDGWGKIRVGKGVWGGVIWGGEDLGGIS